MMKSRAIYYIDETEDELAREAEEALSRTIHDNFYAYCETIVANYAMMNIDVVNYPIKREIYFLEDDPNQ